MEEVNVRRDQEKSKLYISDTPIYMDASSIITACVHSENPDFRWLTKLKINADVPILEKLKNDSEQENENKELKKELLEQRLMYPELQRKMIAHQEEAKVREEALVKGYNDLKESMDKQFRKDKQHDLRNAGNDEETSQALGCTPLLVCFLYVLSLFVLLNYSVLFCF